MKKPRTKKQPAPRASFKPRYFWDQFTRWYHAKLFHRILAVTAAVIMVWVGGMYGIAEWYIFSQRNKPVVLGATFISDYAEYLGVDPQQTLTAIFDELGVKHIRLVSYWDNIEARPGQYDFNDLDWQMKLAEQRGVKVSLAIGLRQPRWPECHMPAWVDNESTNQWYPQLNAFITAVVKRYQHSPALDSYQLENEYFLRAFGKCTDFNRDRLIAETNLVRSLDPTHTLIISRSNNAIGLPLGQPQPDEFGVSVYKRVWDRTITKRYFEYPFPAWFYGTLAGAGKIVTGKDLVIHELQAEAWTPDGYDIKDAPVDELYKSMNPERLRDRVQYAEASGIKEIDLWGVEWWYQMKIKRGEPALWDTARQLYAETATENAQLN